MTKFNYIHLLLEKFIKKYNYYYMLNDKKEKILQLDSISESLRYIREGMEHFDANHTFNSWINDKYAFGSFLSLINMFSNIVSLVFGHNKPLFYEIYDKNKIKLDIDIRHYFSEHIFLRKLFEHSSDMHNFKDISNKIKDNKTNNNLNNLFEIIEMSDYDKFLKYKKIYVTHNFTFIDKKTYSIYFEC